MKKTTLLILLCLAIPTFTIAGELRVSQLGSGWLVPDEYVDALYNPARINYIIPNTLIANLSAEYFYDAPETSSINNRQGIITKPNGVFLGKLGDVYYGISSGIIYDYRFYNNPSIDLHQTFDESIMGIAGMRFNENVCIGAKLSYLNGYLSNYISVKGASLGLNYEKDGLDLGVNISGSSGFDEIERYAASIDLMGGLKISDNAEIRFINTIEYGANEQKIDSEILPANLTGEYFGKKVLSDITGVSAIIKSEDTKYVFGVSNAWTIFHYYSEFDGIGQFKALDIADYLKINIGIETPLIVDWLLFRINYNPLTIFYMHEKRTHGFSDDKESTDISFLKPYTVDVGFCIITSAVSKIDIGFFGSGLYSYNYDNYYSDYDSEHKQAYYRLHFKAEYTQKF